MSSTQYTAGQSHGQTQAKAEQWAESAKGTANSAVDKAENATQNAQQSAQQRRAEEGETGFLQQTGEQMISMAQGAIDGVKNTLGMGGDQKK
ncbi:unnamed protein product [Cuscuta campestris]|uniref:Late embryogenesis abundant protein 1 n=1 Tax=Cuscuta campestris TaxID=132261 RepID=A0A484MTT9_9ASTE|nr:unnamed protein product [Cuscuta campestris]